ncbi:MAG TPA: DUF4157 domain-containing protein, partial [Chitinophagaceae bacterium]|nr:DUF4157 domain-containing protein [Chitinophagaceae bacterium]
KLSIGKPGDPYEREADAVADKVVQRLSEPNTQVPNSDTQIVSPIIPKIQSECAECEKEDELQKKEIASEIVQEEPQKKLVEDKNEEKVQTKIEPVLPTDAKLVTSQKVTNASVQSKCDECAEGENLQKKEEEQEPEDNLMLKAIFESNEEKAEPEVIEKNNSLQKKSAVGGTDSASVVQAKCDACKQESKIMEKEQEKDEIEEIDRKPIFESENTEPIVEEKVQKQENVVLRKEISIDKKTTAVKESLTPVVKAEAPPIVQTKMAPVPTPPVIQAKSAASETEMKLDQKDEEGEDDLVSKIMTGPVFNGNNVIPENETDLPEEFNSTIAGGGNLQRATLPGQGATASPRIENRLNSSKGGGSPLSTEVNSSMSEAFDADFSDVRIHNDSSSAQMSKDLNAQAFTHGKDVYFNEGKYDPNSKAGKHLLAHELTHTIQQGGIVARKEKKNIQRKLGISTVSPKIQRGIIDDIASYFLTGNAFLDFIVGVVAGIIEWVADLIMGIVNLFREAFSGNIGAIIAVIGLIAIIVLTIIFPEVMVPILLAIGLIAGVISFFYYIYMMTRPGLTPYERGKFLGKAIVEALLIIITAAELIKFAKTFAQISKLAAGASLLQRLRWVRTLLRAGSLPKILRLLEQVKDVEKTIELLELAKDIDKALELMRLGKNADSIIELLRGGTITVDKLLELLNIGKLEDAAQLRRLLESIKVADAELLERLLRNTKITNGAQLEGLLGRAKVADGVQLERLLNNAKIIDGAQLERLLDNAKVLDGAQLESLLGKVRILDAAQLERLLNNAKVLDGAQLGSLLDKAKLLDGAQLERLLNDAKIVDGAQVGRLLDNAKLADGAELERLLALVDDGNRLERLLAMADTGVQLESFLRRAGGAAQAANLEDVMRLAGPGRVARLEDLLNIAAGNAARFAELADHTRWLGARVPAPAIAPPPDVAHFGFGGANMPHFLDAHTFDFMDIPGRLANPHWPHTTFWPRGTTPAQVSDALGEALRNLNPVGGPRLPAPGHPLPTVGGGFNVQVGSRPPVAAPIIGQFFPTAQPGLVTMLRNELQAIWNILMP